MVNNIFVRQLRNEAGLSQAHMAKELGLSRASYIAIEGGRKDITLQQAEILARMFSVSLDEIQRGEKMDKHLVVEKTKRPPKKDSLETRVLLPKENIKKFKEVLLYILEKVGGKPNVGMTVLYKLLYFIDFDYYEKYEEQLIGARYIKNIHGPSPVAFSKVIESMKEDGEVEEVKSKYFQYEQKKFLARRAANLSILSAQEKEVIDDVLVKLSDKTAKALSDYSHADVPWKVAESGKLINYETVFYRTDPYSVRQYDEL